MYCTQNIGIMHTTVSHRAVYTDKTTEWWAANILHGVS